MSPPHVDTQLRCALAQLQAGGKLYEGSTHLFVDRREAIVQATPIVDRESSIVYIKYIKNVACHEALRLEQAGAHRTLRRQRPAFAANDRCNLERIDSKYNDATTLISRCRAAEHNDSNK